MLNGKRIASERWENFLGRKPLTLDQAETQAALSGKRILITGAGGWIGSSLARAVAGFAPEQLVLLEASERNLYEIDRDLASTQKAAVLGSVSDPILLAEVFDRYQPQIIYHAAAFKHVPLMEQNPFAAIENNAIGTNLLVQAAQHAGAEQVILLSTDKAVDPVNIMGASKRIAELVLLARSTAATPMKALRLGNVLGSEGSVVPLFRKQILAGGPVTVTHPEARRYFLTTEDAVVLLLEASSAQTASSILTPDLGEPIAMEELAQYLIGEEDVPLVFTQLRPGDKLCEALISTRETYATRSGSGDLRSIDSPALSPALLDEILQQLQRACSERSLTQLLQAVLRAVPEYRPSTQIQKGVTA
jgi:FlaA1/EpsC-like NDP-sugar epimerase